MLLALPNTATYKVYSFPPSIINENYFNTISSLSHEKCSDRLIVGGLAVFAQQKSGMKGVAGKVYCEDFSPLQN